MSVPFAKDQMFLELREDTFHAGKSDCVGTPR